MKNTSNILCGLIFLFALNSFAGPAFTELKASSAKYNVGQAAVLTAQIKIQPANSNTELFLTAGFDNRDIKITRVSDDQAVSVTPAFTTPGVYTWRVNVYLQDKAKSQSFNASLSFYKQENLRIEKALSIETDPVIRANLIAQSNRNNEIIWHLNSQLWQDRRQIETRTLEVVVAESSVASRRIFESNPVISVDCDHENQSYVVGESATFFVHVLTEFKGSDGIQEVVASGYVIGDSSHADIATERKRLGSQDFSFVGPSFQVSDVGSRVFRSWIQIRSKAQADSIRRTVSDAAKSKARYIALIDGTEDTMSQIYYRQQIAELDLFINELNKQLQDLLVSVGPAKDFYFSVVP